MIIFLVYKTIFMKKILLYLGWLISLLWIAIISPSIETNAQWIDEPITATLMTWSNFNMMLKSLSKWYDVTSISISDYQIKSIVTADIIPDWVTTRLISAKNSQVPVYARYDSGTIYYYTMADKIYLNEDSSNMFYYFFWLQELDLSSWDTSNVTNMRYMFYGCSSLTSLDVSNFDTSKVTDMESMFYNCNKLTSLDVSNWDTSNVTNMGSMFSLCSRLTSLDVSNFDTSNVTNMYSMFRECRSLTELDVSNFDTSNVTDMESMFNHCENLTSLDVSNFDTSNVTNMGAMFYWCSNLTSLDVSNFDTSNVTYMWSMFNDCYRLTSLDVSNFDTSKVRRMDYMFYGCSRLTSLDVSNFDTSNVTNMEWMFYRCRSLTSLDLSNFDTSNVTNMSYMFIECSNLTSLDVSNFDTSNVTNMGYMFRRCSNLTSLDVSNFDTSNVTNMRYMFRECSNLTSLDISNWDTSNVTNMDFMFIDCSNLNYIYASDGFSIATSSSSMFYNTPKLMWWNWTKYDSSKTDWTYAKVDTQTQSWYFTDPNAITVNIKMWNNLLTQIVRRWDTIEEPNVQNVKWWYYFDWVWYSPFSFDTVVTNYLSINAIMNWNWEDWSTAKFLPWSEFNIAIKRISQSGSNITVGVPNNTIYNIKRAEIMPDGVYFISLSTQDSEDSIYAWYDRWTLYYYTDAETIYLNEDSSQMFYYFEDLQTIDTDGWDTSKVTNMSDMFYSCSSLTSLDVSNFDTSNVTSMGSMFYNCSSLASLDVRNFDTSKVTNMNAMFQNCNSLTSLDVSNWNTSNVTSMGSMFSSCRSLTSLDVSNWNTSKVTYMNAMFHYCSSLTSLDLSNFDTSNVTNMGSMFSSCSSLTSLDLSNFDTSKVTDMGGMFTSCSSLVSLNLSNFDTSKVTYMNAMFHSCSSLVSLNLSNWDTSNVTSMGSMFYNCSSLTSLDVSNFDTSKVERMDYMFMGCENLQTIIVSDLFSTEKIDRSYNSEYMFKWDTKLVWWFGTIYDAAHIDKEYARIDGLSQFGYFTSNTIVPDQKQVQCKQEWAPANASYIEKTVTVYWIAASDEWREPINCDWKCDDTYELTKNNTCMQTKLVQCKQEWAPANASYIVKNVKVYWDIQTDEWESPTRCQRSCNEWYQKKWNKCVVPRAIREQMDGNINTLTICDQNDSNKCMTIMDRNLWATEAGIWCYTQEFQCTPNTWERFFWTYDACLESMSIPVWNQIGGSMESCIEYLESECNGQEASQCYITIHYWFDSYEWMCDSPYWKIELSYYGIYWDTAEELCGWWDYKWYDSYQECAENYNPNVDFNKCVSETESQYWNYYQWWNNYGFPKNWSITKKQQKIDCSAYGPLTPFNSNVFSIVTRSPYDYCQITNDNMRWWWNDTSNNNYWYPVTNPIERQWPCPDWYHVPSLWEFVTLVKMRKWNVSTYGITDEDIYYTVATNEIVDFSKDFKIPLFWRYSTDGYYYTPGFGSFTYYSLFRLSSNDFTAIVYEYDDYIFEDAFNWTKADGVPVRCFRNTPLEPIDDNKNNNVEEYSSSGGVWRKYNDNKIGEKEKIRESLETWNMSWLPNDKWSAEWFQYSDEFQEAYKFAYKNWITTMPTIEDAKMEWPLTRIAMAKMLSYYAINVLWQKPDETRINKFNDISEKMDKEYDNGVTLSYQLWIMWINMPNNKFRPKDEVTRAEFATALSRMLYKLADWKDKYYSTHLAKLMEEKIITNDNPNMKELRGYVMIMLMRAAAWFGE